MGYSPVILLGKLSIVNLGRGHFLFDFKSKSEVKRVFLKGKAVIKS